jgi:gliding motility-associated-like protein
MKKVFYILLIICSFVKAKAQVNIVPNPSFEALLDSILCPVCCIDLTPPWQNPTGGSPNFYAACTTVQPDYDVPQNIYGYQLPHTGIGYAGFGVYPGLPPFITSREYIQVQLTDTLKVNKRYKVSFFVSLSDSAQLATDDIGAYFSDTAIHKGISDSSPFSDFTPQIINSQGNFLIDKENWMEISGIYTALGGEQFITIGNFYDDANTDTISVNGGIFYNSYYYIDDVSVTIIPDTIEPIPPENDIFIPNIFSPNNDLNNDVLFVRSHNIKEMIFSIYNRWGEKVFESKEISKGWDGTYKGLACNEGVFFYYLNATLQDGTIVQKKGNVTLIR